MIRLVLMSGKWYGMEIDSIEDDLDDIEEFIASGDIVALAEDMETAICYLGQEITVVEA